MVGSLYNLVAKVLTSIVGEVIENLVSPNQISFPKRRLLVDGLVVVNEVIDLTKKTIKPCIIFKLDFEKVCALMSWEFLEHMLLRFGLYVKWRSWIRAYAFVGYIIVLVNGYPT